MNRKLHKTMLFLLLGGAIGTASAQSALKVGDNMYNINDKAVLEVESTTKGFLLPRMTVAQRDAIVSPPEGLQIWCTDSNISTTPASAELCVYLDNSWVPVAVVRNTKLSTAKGSDVNASVMISPTSATINGTLVSTLGVMPTETGVVWKEIVGNDFSTLPSLDGNAVAIAPVYKTVGTLVTTPGGAISVSIPTLTSTTSGTSPYYFRTYAKSASGVGYGNTIVLNSAPPVISTPVVTNGSTFAGTLTVNAGALAGTVTEYGYCTSTTNNVPTTADNKVVRSTIASLATLNTALNAESFTANPKIDLAVNDYMPTTSGTVTYFTYYAIVNGITIYSPVATFTPVIDPVTGGSAVATVSVSSISTAAKIGVVSSSTFTATFTVTTPGTYAGFTLISATGATTGLTIATVPAGTFAVGTQTLTFSVTGTPGYALEGNTFTMSRIGALVTGPITDADPTGNAICDGTSPTIVVPVTSAATQKIWMDRNLGASRAGTSATDYQAYGCLYQWGRGNDGHASINWISGTSGTPVNGSTPTLSGSDSPGNNLFITTNTSPRDWRSPQNDALWQGLGGTNNPCPAYYRVPTLAEVNAEMGGITNMANASTSFLKFTAAGSRDGINANNFSNVGATGKYWASNIDTTFSSVRFITPASTFTTSNSRRDGFSVRCIKN